MAHKTLTDTGMSIAQDRGRTHFAITDAPQTSATFSGFTSDTPVAPAMPSALQRVSSMTRRLQLVRYESLSLALRGPAHHALQFMSMSSRQLMTAHVIHATYGQLYPRGMLSSL